MAATTETQKSTYITNRDATPVKGTGASIAHGGVRSAFGYVTVAASSTSASYYPLCSVPSNARVSGVTLQTAALGTACTMNVGVYVPTVSNTSLLALSAGYTAGVAINSTFYVSAVSVATAYGPTNQIGNVTISTQEKELWDALGLASDPNCDLDISCTLAVSAVAGGLIRLNVDYAF